MAIKDKDNQSKISLILKLKDMADKKGASKEMKMELNRKIKAKLMVTIPHNNIKLACLLINYF